MSIQINVSSKKYQCDLGLRHKVSIVVGESGKGKTVLVKALSDRSGAYKVSLSDERFRVVVLSIRDYEAQLSFYGGTPCIFVVDDEDFMYTESFARYLAEDRSSYFLLICRLEPGAISGSVLANVGFSAKAVYRFESDGIRHWLEQVYDMPKQKGGLTPELIDFCLVEDSTTGYEFFKRIFKDTISTNGKTNIVYCLKKHLDNLKGKAVFLAVDLAGAGFYVEEARRYCKLNNIRIYLLRAYESFEYMVLLSNMFGYDRIRLEEENLLQYSTLEQKCTDTLMKMTEKQPSRYGKKKSCTCYYLDCCHVKRDSKCSFGVAGDKISSMLKGTVFEVLLKLRQVPGKGE